MATKLMKNGLPSRGAYVTVEETDPGLLEGIAARAAMPEFGLETIEAFEDEERSIFEGWGGKYVKTGTVRASLTESDAPGAVRILTPGGFTFGTSIWYAVFQGTTGVGNKQPPSAIIKVSALELAAAASDLSHYIMRGRQAGLV